MNMIYKEKPTARVDGKLNFLLSSPFEVDAMNDIVGDPDEPVSYGWDIDSVFRKNPACFYGHDTSKPPIARWKNVGVRDRALRGTLEFVPPGVSPFADEISALVDAGYIKGCSVGFRANKSKPRDSGRGTHFLRQTLVEVSLCGIPALPSALLEARAHEARAMGISEQTIQKVFRQQPAANTLGQKIRVAKQRIADARRAFENSPTAYQRNINFGVLNLLQEDYIELICQWRGIQSPKARAAEKRKEDEKELKFIVQQIATAWSRYADANMDQDIALQLRCMKTIERLEVTEAALKKKLGIKPAPPKPPVKSAMSNRWSDAQERQRKADEQRSVQRLQRLEQEYQQAQREAFLQGFEDFREREAEFRRRK